MQTGFRNIIVCEDIRDEVGNKKSLIGVFGGDIVSSELPVTLQLAVYMQYVPSPADGDRLSCEFRLLYGDREMAKGRLDAPLKPNEPTTLVIPKALATFDTEDRFRVVAIIGGGSEIEILAMKIIKGALPS